MQPAENQLHEFLHCLRWQTERRALRMLERHPELARQSLDNGFTALHMAATRGVLPSLEALLDAGAAPNAADSSGRTPAAAAADLGHSAAARALIERGVRLDVFLAATLGDIPGVAALLRASPHLLESTNRRARTPLKCAASMGHIQVVSLLLAVGADIHATAIPMATPLHEAIRHGHLAVGELLRSNGAVADVFIASGAGWMVDLDAILAAQPAMADARDSAGSSPLHWAARNGRVDSLTCLLGAGSVHDAADHRGQPPLHIAAGGVEGASVELLVGAGHPVNARDHVGNTPLHLAAANRCPGPLRALLAHGADPNSRNRRSETPLHRVSPGDDNAARRVELLAHGAEVNAQDDAGCSPLHLAARDGYASTCMALISAGASIELRDARGRTALHWAADYHQRLAVEVLLDSGALPSVSDREARTPLDLAAEYGGDEVVELLAKHLGLTWPGEPY